MNPRTQALREALHDLDISLDELWVSCFSVGAAVLPRDLTALATGDWDPPRHEHDRIALALNELYRERGTDRTVPYYEDFTTC